MLEFLGVIVLVFLGIFLPRVAVCILAGALLGGAWWILFIPLACFAFKMEVEM